MADDAAVPRPVEESQPAATRPATGSVHRMALVAGQVLVVVMAGLVGWLSFRVYEDRQAEAQRDLFVHAARQGAVNLTTIDYEHADADMQRILDSATGSFRNSFSRRWRPLFDLVTRDRSKLVGTVTDIGLESQDGDVGQVLAAVTVKSAKPEHAQQEPQVWLLRITVKKAGDQGKISNVAFVS